MTKGLGSRNGHPLLHKNLMLPSEPEITGAAKKPTLDQLISLGLTDREAEVLSWVARGKGNYEIGVILGARPRTISKHVEHILSKLKVENRTTAAAIAFTACSQLSDLF